MQYIKMLAPAHVNSSGQLIASGLPPQHPGFKSNIQGGLLEHGAVKTASSIKAQAGHAQKAGVTMRGGGLVEIPRNPTIQGQTISGVSAEGNTAKLLGGLNQLRSSQVYDKLGSAQPYKVKLGGKRRKRHSRTKRNKKNVRHNSHKRSKRNRRKHTSRIRHSSNSRRK